MDGSVLKPGNSRDDEIPCRKKNCLGLKIYPLDPFKHLHLATEIVKKQDLLVQFELPGRYFGSPESLNVHRKL